MFTILKYIKPSWYFNLPPLDDYGYFPAKDSLTQQSLLLEVDQKFEGTSAEHELAYRAHVLGCIDRNFNKGIDWWGNSKISLNHEYLFARKYFHKSRVWMALLLRVLTFHNPFSEIVACISSSGMKRVSLKYDKQSEALNFKNFQPTFNSSADYITVVIPTLNRYNLLKDVLNDFEKQDYKNFEVLVIDQSDNFDKSYYDQFKLQIKVIRQEEKALWKARNTAIKNTKGSWIAFSEDDVRIPADWLSNHLKCVTYFNADISNGVFFPVGGMIPENVSFFKWSDQFATGNSFVKKTIFHKTGLFDLQFEKQRMGDGEFGLRAYKAGLKSISNPYAWCEDLKAKTGGLREMGNWDAFRPKSIWSPRPLPSVLYLHRKYFGFKATFLLLMINLPPSLAPYRFKRNKLMLAAGSFITILISPLIFVQVVRSWRIATRMLRNPLIEDFK